MRALLAVFVIVLVAGCGKNRPAPGSWPAQIVGHEGFTDNQWSDIKGAVDYLNTGSGKKLVFQEGETGGNYPITFKYVENSADHTSRAGLAIFDDESCTIEVSSVVFAIANHETLIPVINHELGHCAGLEHDPQQGQVMYRSATSLKAYSSDSLGRFFQEVLINVGM